MNSGKLKLKYHLGIWRNLDSYPTEEDILYEVWNYIHKMGDLDTGFTNKILKYSSKITKASKHKANAHFESLVNNGYFEKKHENSYKLKVNPINYPLKP